MIITCIAVDDEPKALSVIRNHASNTPILDLKEIFLDPYEAIDYLKIEKIDLIFLDINMPYLSGINLIKLIPRNSLIIFTTAYSEYAINAFELDVVDYLLKPFDLNRFSKAIEKASKKLNQLSGDYIFLNNGSEMKKIFLQDILYLESAGNYIKYITKNETILTRSTIKETLKHLSDKQFIQIHRSIIVAINHINIIDENFLVINGKKLPIGKKFKLNFKKNNIV
jgi:two-component system LytT family response regulator